MPFSRLRSKPIRNSRNARLRFEKLERRNLLANDVLPDIFAWASEENGYLYDYEVEGELLRFTTAFANGGDGHLEVHGGDVLPNGNQEVLQRIYDDEGGFRDRVAGEFTYHEGHGHIHFDGYAIYNLRNIGPGGEVGDIVATGGKISFCLIDITPFSDDAGSSQYGSCGTTQGVSAGWSDVYGRFLSDQWINISGVDDGDYYLEVVTDPEDQLIESDETNNTTIITVTIEDGPGAQGDRFESNNSFATASNLGMFSERVEAGLSIHTADDEDFYQFNAVDHGDFSIHVNFSNELGNIDAYVYDNEFNLVASGESTDDLEDLHFHTHPDQAYFLKIVSADGQPNGYDLEFDGPGEVTTVTSLSDDVPVAIPDGAGSSQPGTTATSQIEGPDITLTDANLILADLDHSWVGDLNITLTSPAGTSATILRSTFETPSGPLGGDNDFTNTMFDDQAPTSIADGTAPFTGSFNANYGDISNPLSVFNGENALGTWTLSVTDWFSADSGTINAWGMMFTGIDNNLGDLLEQNDAIPQATDLGVIGTTSINDLSIHKQSDVDFFRFVAQDSTEVRIELDFLHDNGNLDFVVYDSKQQEIGRADSITNNEYLVLPTEEGKLYFIEVYGFESQTNDYNFGIDVPKQVAKSGIIQNVDNAWQTVVLPGTFDNPVVLVSSPSGVGTDSAIVQVNNVTSSSFDVRLERWNPKGELSSALNLEYLVVEAGTHTLRDGTTLSAGASPSHPGGWTDVSFSSSFASAPVVLTQVENQDSVGLVNRLSDVDTDGFRMMLQSPEKWRFEERLKTYWIAIEAGPGSSDSGLFEVGTVSATDALSQFEFQGSYTGNVNALFASAQTTNDIDPASARLYRVNSGGAAVFLEEDTYGNDETTHGSETVGWLALHGGANFYAIEDSQSDKFSSGGNLIGKPGNDSATVVPGFQRPSVAHDPSDNQTLRNRDFQRKDRVEKHEAKSRRYELPDFEFEFVAHEQKQSPNADPQTAKPVELKAFVLDRMLLDEIDLLV